MHNMANIEQVLKLNEGTDKDWRFGKANRQGQYLGKEQLTANELTNKYSPTNILTTCMTLREWSMNEEWMIFFYN